MVASQGRSERRGEAYASRYVEPLNIARTQRMAVFNILNAGLPPHHVLGAVSPQPSEIHRIL